MDLQTILYNLAKTAQLSIPPTTRFEPTSHGWNAIGGPEKANITVWGNVNALWETIEWLRCPVELYNARGEALWWGYVAEVEIRVGAVTCKVSLDTMSNKIAVAYSAVAAGSATVGARATTSYSTDSDSATEYGTKELLHSASGMTAAAATGVRDRLLDAKKYPVPALTFIGENSLSATLHCRGWWDTLKWRYLTQAGTVSTVTTTQISDILTSVGEFVTSATIDTASGISTSQYRAGDNKAQSEIIELLSMGTSGSLRYLCEVKQDRTLRVYTEPVSAVSSDYQVDSFGRLYNQYGQLVEPSSCPVAFWARLKDVIPDTADLTKLAKPDPVFVQRSSFNVANQRLTFESREAGSVWDVGGLA